MGNWWYIMQRGSVNIMQRGSGVGGALQEMEGSLRKLEAKAVHYGSWK